MKDSGTVLLCLVISLLTCLTSSHGQIRVGLFAEKSFSVTKASSIEFTGETIYTNYNIEYIGESGTHFFGMTAEKDFGKLFLQADFGFRTTSYKYLFKQENVLESNFASIMVDEWKSLSIGVMYGIKKNNFTIGVGPIFDFRMDEKLELESMEGFKATDRSIKTHVQLGMGYTFLKRAKVSVKYGKSLSNPLDRYRYSGRRLNMKTTASFISLGLSVFM